MAPVLLPDAYVHAAPVPTKPKPCALKLDTFKWLIYVLVFENLIRRAWDIYLDLLHREFVWTWLSSPGTVWNVEYLWNKDTIYYVQSSSIRTNLRNRLYITNVLITVIKNNIENKFSLVCEVLWNVTSTDSKKLLLIWESLLIHGDSTIIFFSAGWVCGIFKLANVFEFVRRRVSSRSGCNSRLQLF